MSKFKVVMCEQKVHTYYVLHNATKGPKYIKKDVDDGCLAFFEDEEDAQRAKRRHPGTEYTRVDYYRPVQIGGSGSDGSNSDE